MPKESKQAAARRTQGYLEYGLRCANCRNYLSEHEHVWDGYYKEKKKRCAIGGFAIKKTGWCPCHEFKDKEN